MFAVWHLFLRDCYGKRKRGNFSDFKVIVHLRSFIWMCWYLIHLTLLSWSGVLGQSLCFSYSKWGWMKYLDQYSAFIHTISYSDSNSSDRITLWQELINFKWLKYIVGLQMQLLDLFSSASNDAWLNLTRYCFHSSALCSRLEGSVLAKLIVLNFSIIVHANRVMYTAV